MPNWANHLEKYSIPKEPKYIGYPNQIPIEIQFELGEWYVIALSNDSEMKRDYAVTQMMFHQKWLLPFLE